MIKHHDLHYIHTPYFADPQVVSAEGCDMTKKLSRRTLEALHKLATVFSLTPLLVPSETVVEEIFVALSDQQNVLLFGREENGVRKIVDAVTQFAPNQHNVEVFHVNSDSPDRTLDPASPEDMTALLTEILLQGNVSAPKPEPRGSGMMMGLTDVASTTMALNVWAQVAPDRPDLIIKINAPGEFYDITHIV